MPLASVGGSVRTNSDISYSGYARFCLFNLLRSLKFEHGDEVLVPAYVCDALILPLERLGVVPRYYSIDNAFQVDFDSIVMSSKIKAIISVNYFGMSQNYERLSSFAADNKIMWINDNAHGFAGAHGDIPLDMFGDFSITSPRKIMPIPNGAFVRINNEKYASYMPEIDRMNSLKRSRVSSGFLAKGILKNLGLSRRLPDYSNAYMFSDDELCDEGVSSFVVRSIVTARLPVIRESRRSIYSAVTDLLISERPDGIASSVPYLNDGNSPQVYPLHVSGEQRWKRILESARARQMDIHTWPSLPRDVLKSNRCKAFDMWKQHVYLPIHQELDKERYIRVLREIFDAV